jgi:hypothetical protein
VSVTATVVAELGIVVAGGGAMWLFNRRGARADAAVYWPSAPPPPASALGDNSVAVLSHVEHGDLRIGRGVYVIRRARQALTGPAALPARAVTPKAEPDWREAID